MATKSDTLASSVNFGAFGKAKELKQRLLFTLGALIVYRLGTFIPIPGIDPAVIGDLFAQQSDGILMPLLVVLFHV
jgi:preprotein translocase subunit SecY